jgi:hypothetical protein
MSHLNPVEQGHVLCLEFLVNLGGRFDQHDSMATSLLIKCLRNRYQRLHPLIQRLAKTKVRYLSSEKPLLFDEYSKTMLMINLLIGNCLDKLLPEKGADELLFSFSCCHFSNKVSSEGSTYSNLSARSTTSGIYLPQSHIKRGVIDCHKWDDRGGSQVLTVQQKISKAMQTDKCKRC